MRRMVEKMMACHGRLLTVEHGGEKRALRAFLQPVNGRVERLALPRMGPLGRESREQFVYIGPAEPALVPDDRVEADGKDYQVRSAQVVWAGDAPVYCWAMCVKEGGDGAWGSSV